MSDQDPRPIGRMGGYTAFAIGDELHLIDEGDLTLDLGGGVPDPDLAARLARLSTTGQCECGATTRITHLGGVEMVEITHQPGCPLDRAVRATLGRSL